MKVKVFKPGASGKIEFTQSELEALLNEVYNEGFSEGKRDYWKPYISCTYGNGSPSITNTSNTTGSIKIDPCYSINTTDILGSINTNTSST